LLIDAFIQERKQNNSDFNNGGLNKLGVPGKINCCYFKKLALFKNKLNKQQPNI
jgi:hypothetical protein